MKIYALLWMVASLLVGGCKSDKRYPFAGTYTVSLDGTFSKVWDTIRVEIYNKGAGTYSVDRSVGVQRKDAGDFQGKKMKRETYICVFDRQHQQLIDQKRGRVYSVSRSYNELLIGGTKYTRIQ